MIQGTHLVNPCADHADILLPCNSFRYLKLSLLVIPPAAQNALPYCTRVEHTRADLGGSVEFSWNFQLAELVGPPAGEDAE
mmetsp:Transcript_26750/g.22496  ORF Transcript_26750/g.22496 Transcript_26750/m.22496 type:complete len:81 (-) Transcript_26750:46-288(-)